MNKISSASANGSVLRHQKTRQQTTEIMRNDNNLCREWVATSQQRQQQQQYTALYCTLHCISYIAPRLRWGIHKNLHSETNTRSMHYASWNFNILKRFGAGMHLLFAFHFTFALFFLRVFLASLAKWMVFCPFFAICFHFISSIIFEIFLARSDWDLSLFFARSVKLDLKCITVIQGRVKTRATTTSTTLWRRI